MYKQFINFYIFISVLNLTLINSEVIYSDITGIGLGSGATGYVYPTGNEVGNTFTFTAYHNEQDSVQLQDIDGNIIYEYYTRSQVGDEFTITVSTENDGFRFFEAGEEVDFYPTNIKNVWSVQVASSSRMNLCNNEPGWVVEFADQNVKRYYYEPAGEQVPSSYTFNNHLGYKDWVVLTGEITTADNINIMINGSDKTPIHLTFRSDDIGLMIDSHADFTGKTYSDLVETRDNILRKRFSVAIEVDYFGFKIYLNGEFYHFYNHRYALQHLQQINFFGNIPGDGGWKIMRLAWYNATPAKKNIFKL